MRRPPPITEFISYPVSAGVGLLAMAVTGLDLLAGRSSEALEITVQAFWAQPWRLVTSALPHGGVIHLIFNVYWLWVFGSLIEEVFGHVRALLLVAFFAAGSAAAEYAIFRGGIGLSGVNYGLFGMLWVLSRRDRRFFDAVDAATAQLFAVWFFICIGATVAGVMAIANVAHGVGWALGMLAGLAIGGRPTERGLGLAGVVGLMGLSLAGATVLRPMVNMSNIGGLDSWKLGYQALEAGQYQEAVRHYQRAVAINRDDATGWFNLGIAHLESGDAPSAAKAFERAAALEPSNEKYRSAAAQSPCMLASAAAEGGAEEARKRLEDCARALGGEGIPQLKPPGEDAGAPGDAGDKPGE